MKALSAISSRLGYTVSGSDIKMAGHDKQNITGKDLVVYSGAVPEDNEELSYAKEIGVPVMERAEFLSFIADKFEKTLAVAGCHGKTTTTAMLGEVFSYCNPTMHLGGDYEFGFDGGRRYFITEACEYRRSFLKLSPDIAIITNVDFDHPDTYADIGETAEAFRTFAASSGKIILNGDEAICRKIAANGTTYGFSDSNDYVIKIFGGGFDLFYHDIYAGTFRPRFSEPFNIKNAAAAIVAGYEEGLCYGDIKEGIERFRGVKRRGEIIENDGRCVVLSDYSHHPAEISERIASLKKQYGEVAVIFQPHTFSRTAALGERFKTAFALAAETVFTDTFAAREKQGDDLLILRLAEPYCRCSYVPKKEIYSAFICLRNKYACVAVMGAGDVQELIFGERAGKNA